MRKTVICALAALAMLAGCGNNKGDNQGAGSDAEEVILSDGSEVEKDGVYSIYREPVVAEAQTTDGQNMRVEIYVTPDMDLPTVENESFKRIYCDNRADVMVTLGGDTVAQEQYTKESFAEYVDATIMPTAILSRLTYRGMSGDEMKLEAEVSVPHSDEEAYITIYVGRDGSVRMEPYTIEEIPDEM